MRRNTIHKSVPAALSGNDLDQLCTDNPLQGGVGEAQGQVITRPAASARRRARARLARTGDGEE
jgi:hypothetical protein